MFSTPNLHHGMTKRELARHIADPYAAGHGGRYVATPNIAQWYIGDIEHTHAEYHGAQHLKDEMRKAIAMLGLPEVR